MFPHLNKVLKWCRGQETGEPPHPWQTQFLAKPVTWTTKTCNPDWLKIRTQVLHKASLSDSKRGSTVRHGHGVSYSEGWGRRLAGAQELKGILDNVARCHCSSVVAYLEPQNSRNETGEGNLLWTWGQPELHWFYLKRTTKTLKVSWWESNTLYPLSNLPSPLFIHSEHPSPLRVCYMPVKYSHLYMCIQRPEQDLASSSASFCTFLPWDRISRRTRSSLVLARLEDKFSGST